MLSCPNCNSRLVRKPTRQGVVFPCERCGGIAVSLPVLRKDARSRDFLKVLWFRTRTNPVLSKRKCPHCNRRMTLVTLPVGPERHPLNLDVCTLCRYVWFDPREYAEVPRAPAPAPEELSPRAREAVALMELEKATRKYELISESEEAPDAWWMYIPALLGMPVEYDANPVRRWPVVTWTVTAVTVLAYIISSMNLRASVDAWGFIPGQWNRHGSLTLLTSFFLHGGIFHLASNMYFFLVFGDNVEDRLGKWRFVLLLAASHLAGMLLHGLLEPRGDVPCVGASAGISGVIAYYAIAFPRARLGYLIFPFFLRWIRMPAIVAFIFFLLLQIVGAWKQISGFGHVSNLGHLGGLIVGLLAAIAVRLGRSDAYEPSPSAVARARRR